PNRALRLLFGQETLGGDPPVAVGRLALAKLDRVNHPVAVKPVIAVARLENRVGPVAQIDPEQVARNLALDLKIVGGDFGRGGCKHATQEKVFGGTQPDWNFALDLEHAALARRAQP